MAKSKRKSGSSTDVSRWETELAQASLNEDDWKTVVLFAVPNKVDDVKHCIALSESISTGIRKLFSVIEYDALIKEVKDLSHGKGGKVKTSKPPPFVEIVDSIKTLIEQGDDIPPTLLAKLIKFKMLMIKQKDIERREDERKAAEAAAKQAKQEERSRSKMGSSPGKRSKSQSPGRKKGKKDDAPPSPKKDTKLKKRGELEDTFKTIDDEPDGETDPQHYIIVTSVYEPRVFQPLIDLGVVVDGVLNVKSETYQLKDEQQNIVEDDEQNDEEGNKEANLVNDGEEEKRQVEKIQERLKHFWEDVEKVIRDSPSGTKMKNIANLSILVKDSVIPQGDIKEIDQEKKTEYGTKVFDYAANVCYNLLDAKKRYKRYIENLKLTHVPSVKETISSCKSNVLASSLASTGFDATTVERQAPIPDIDMRYYNHLMDQVPYEAHSVPLLFDSLLRQVEATVDQKDPMDEPIPPRKDLLDHSLGEYLDGKLQQLGLKSPAVKTNKVKELSNEPVILHNGDERTRRIHHLKEMENISPRDAEQRVYDNHQVISLINHALSDYGDKDDLKSVSMRKQQLSHFCSAVENQSKFDKILALMSFEVLPLKVVGPDGEVSRPMDGDDDARIGWDDPYILKLLLNKGPYENSGVGDENIKDLKILRNLSEYVYSEYFDPKVFPQVLDQAMEMRPYLDMYYHRGLSHLLLVLHNPRDDQLKNCKSWDTWLHSNVGFRNYLQHVAEEIAQWQIEEDVQEEIRNRPVTPQTPPREPTPVPIKTGNRNNMITRAEMLELKEAEEDKHKKKSRKSRSRSRSPEKRPVSGAKKGHSPDKREKTSSSLKRTPSGRRATSRVGTARKNLKSSQEKKPEPIESHETETAEDINKEYPFHGYDVGDELVHISGETSYLFPSDGSLIKFESYDYVHRNKANKTAVYKDNNVLVLNMKNPFVKSDEPVKKFATDEGETEENGKQADADEKDEDERNEFDDLISTMPAIPEICEPRCEESHLSINFNDGMRVGLESQTSTRLKCRLEALKSSVQTLKDSVKKMHSPGMNASTLNAKATSPKGKRNKEDELKKQEELEKQIEKETRERIEATIKDVYDARRAYLGCRNLSVSCPDGLQLTFVHDEVKNELPRKTLSVRQEYVVNENGKHACDDKRSKILTEERARLITIDGTVIKFMADGSVVILFSDGSLCTSPAFTPPMSSLTESRLSEHADASGTDASSISKKPGTQLTTKPPMEAFTEETGAREWLLVKASGERYQKTLSSEEMKLSDVIICHAICPRTEKILETREDGVITVKHPDGTVIVEHNDGTRITTYYVDVSKGMDNETGEEEIRRHEPIKYVKVECVGYATVLINKEKEEIETLFGDTSKICATLHGEYKIQKPDLTQVFINQKGETIFAPNGTVPDFSSKDSLVSLFEHIEGNGIPPGVYLLKLADSNCVSTVDQSGNEFYVSCSGSYSTRRGEPTKDTSSLDKSLLPRYFVVNKDGSAEELLREADISEFVQKAKQDPTVAILEPPLQREDGFTGKTILRPFKGTKGEIWLKQKDELDIIPSDLKERDFKTLPRKEFKIPGPKFGSNVGIAFQVATKPAAKQPKPSAHCPKVLEMRHIAQFNGLTTEERRKMIEGIENYRKFIYEQTTKEKELLTLDPRNEEEIKKAKELYDKFKEIEVQSKDHPQSNIDVVKVADDYLEATKLPPSPPPQRAQPQRSLKEWEQDRIEIAELKYAKEYLRSGIVPPYFDTEEGQRFLNANQKSSDIEKIAADLAKETVHPSYRPASAATTDSNGLTPDPSNASNPSGELYDLRKSFQPAEDKGSFLEERFNSISPKPSPLDSKLSLSRPGNPTPAEAVNGDSGLGIHRDMQSRNRPYNPTPHHALKSNSIMFSTSVQESINEMPEANGRPHHDSDELGSQRHVQEDNGAFQDAFSSQANFSSAQNELISSGQNEGSSPRFAGLNYTVTGEPRREEVKIPASIRGSKPGALPNQKFMAVEEPVRRQVKTASVAGTVKPESTVKLRGFHLLPDYVDFGILKEGLSYSQTVMLKNVGIDSCRFKIKQPPPSTGLKVLYNPGPVAAGMAARLDVEIFAVAVGVEGTSGVGSVGHHIEIITETDALYLPVAATILTSHEYENRSDSSPRGGPSKNTLLLSNRPSSRDALTRPRKI